jgi:stage II sporulation protein AA (anti-sigma F factor antagonist)
MNISIHRHRDVTVIEVSGTLDSAKSVEFATTLDLVLAEGVNHVLIDFSELIYISSAGLRVIAVALKRIRKSGGELVLCGLKDDRRRIFELTGFTKVIKTFDNKQDALQLWSASDE